MKIRIVNPTAVQAISVINPNNRGHRSMFNLRKTYLVSKQYNLILLLGLIIGMLIFNDLPLTYAQEVTPPNLNDIHVQRFPSVFRFQARVSQVKVPSGRGSLDIYVYITRDGETLCSEDIKNARIRNGILNLEVGRRMSCALDEVLAESNNLKIQLCLGSTESCLEPIFLTAVPFALRANFSQNASMSRSATISGNAKYAQRITADEDLFFPPAVGRGYFDFYTHPLSTSQHVYPLDHANQDYSKAGFIQWTPVRGYQSNTDFFNANEIYIAVQNQDQTGSWLDKFVVHAEQMVIKGRGRIAGTLNVADTSNLHGTLRVSGRTKVDKNLVAYGPIDITGDSEIQGHLTLESTQENTDSTSTLLEVNQDLVILGDSEVNDLITVSHDLFIQNAQEIKFLNEGLTINDTLELDTRSQIHIGYVESTGIVQVGEESLNGNTLVERDIKVFGTGEDEHGATLLIKTNEMIASENENPDGDYGIRKTNHGLLLKLGTTFKSIAHLRKLPNQSTEWLMWNTRNTENPAIDELSPSFNTTVIKAQKIYIDVEKSDSNPNALQFNGGGLGSECTLVMTETDTGKEATFQCGDQSIVIAPDQCGNGRRSRCSCGDGEIQGDEECDDGDDSDNNACLRTCSRARCGDGFTRTDITNSDLEGYEECDDGTNNYDEGSCTTSCLRARCGDGLKYHGVEECDDGNDDNSDDCLNSCKIATCGDGELKTTEECDDGNLNGTRQSLCRVDCTQIECGDGYKDYNEQCDADDVTDDSDCPQCQFAYCGDGFVQAGVEECDDADPNPSTSTPCINCQFAYCGDGLVHPQINEECDLAGHNNNRGVCSTNCQLFCDHINKVDHLTGPGRVSVNTRTQSAQRRSRTMHGSRTFYPGPQVAFTIEAARRQRAIIEVVSADYDTYLHLRNECNDSASVAWDDDSGRGLHSKIDTTLEPGANYVIVDGYGRQSGASTIDVDFIPCQNLPIVATLNNRFGGYIVNTSNGEIFDSSQISCGGFGPQVAIQFTIHRTRFVHFWTDSILYDTVLHIRNSIDCANIQDLLCDDDSGRGLASGITKFLSPGTYYLVVDGYRSQSGSTHVHYAIF